MEKILVVLLFLLMYNSVFSNDKLFVGKELGFVSSYYFIVTKKDCISIKKFNITKMGYSREFECNGGSNGVFNDSMKLQVKAKKFVLLVNDKRIKLKSCLKNELNRFENLSIVTKMSDDYLKLVVQYCNFGDLEKIKFKVLISDYYLKNNKLQLEPNDFEYGFAMYLDQQLSRIDSTCIVKRYK